MAKHNSIPSQPTEARNEVVYSFEAHDDLELRIQTIRAQVEILATLAGTGDVESLSEGALANTLIDIENRLRHLEEHVAKQDPRSAVTPETLAA